MTIPFRYSDKQAPPPSQNVFKIVKTGSDGRPAYSVHVRNVSLMALRNYNKPTVINTLKGVVTVEINHTTFALNLTISPNETGQHQLLFEVAEHGERFEKSGPTFQIRENCEFIFLFRVCVFLEIQEALFANRESQVNRELL